MTPGVSSDSCSVCTAEISQLFMFGVDNKCYSHACITFDVDPYLTGSRNVFRVECQFAYPNLPDNVIFKLAACRPAFLTF